MFNDDSPPIKSIEYNRSTPDANLMRTRSESSGLASRQRRRRARSLRQEQQQPSPDSHKTPSSLGGILWRLSKKTEKCTRFDPLRPSKLQKDFRFLKRNILRITYWYKKTPRTAEAHPLTKGHFHLIQLNDKATLQQL